MLTLVLLAVLAIGVGLIAVFAAEQGHPATDEDKLRRRGAQVRSPADPESVESPTATTWDRVPDAAGPERRSATDATRIVLPVVEGHADVPAPYVAVEGAYGDVAIPSTARRIRSLAALTTIIVVVAAGTAAALGGGFLVVGELLNTAIG